MNKAKEIFLFYCGSYFHMERDEQLTKYKGYNIDRNTEKEWLREYQSELLTKIEEGKSIEHNLIIYCDALRNLRDDKNLGTLFDVIEKKIEDVDTFVRLRISEELLKVINFLLSNSIGKKQKILYYKKLSLDILRKVISEPIIISEETKKNVSFEDTLREESIKQRAEDNLRDFS